jgi:hypothetical protein
MFIRTLRAAASAVIVAGALTAIQGAVLPIAPADALPACTSSNLGAVKRIYGPLEATWMVKQISFEDNYSGSTQQLVFELSQTSTLTDSVSVHASLSAQVQAGIFGHLEATVGTDIGQVGEEQTFSKVTKTYTFKSGDTYFLSKGAMRYRQTVTQKRCRKMGGGTETGWETLWSGTVQGYVKGAGATGCQVDTPARSYSRYVQVHYCS